MSTHPVPRDDAAAFPTPQSSTTMSPIDRAASLDAEEVNEAQQSRTESLTFVWSPNEEVGAVNLICTCIYIYIVYVYMYMCIYIYVYVYMCICVYVCMYKYMYIMCICIYVTCAHI